MLASLGQGNAPDAAPADYVRALFDQYAGNFDQHLQGLQYRTPAALVQALLGHGAAQGASVLDLGCGTGLCGPLLRPWAGRLAGVDLSPRMLEQAGLTGAYDELACADMLDYLGKTAGQWDVLLAADVFVYLGDLQPVLLACRQALKPGGLLGFSVESPAGMAQDLLLQASQRYAHAPAYVERLASANGFEVVKMQAMVMRQDHAQDIAGCIAILRAGASSSS
jgi:predicted TPR repeat methyltransferase